MPKSRDRKEQEIHIGERRGRGFLFASGGRAEPNSAAVGKVCEERGKPLAGQALPAPLLETPQRRRAPEPQLPLASINWLLRPVSP